MKKIPTLFVRDPDDRAHVLDEVTPGCEWVMAGEGVATRKFDGTCVLIRRDGMAVHAFTRREVKPGKEPPANFVELEHDGATGKTVGWEPAAQSGFLKFLAEALEDRGDIVPGTYELIGPKINNNPEHAAGHVLVAHATADAVPTLDCPQGFDELAAAMASLPWEGIVWHHPDGRMVKLKRRDFVS